MRPRALAAVAAIGVVVTLQLSACSFVVGSGDEDRASTGSDAAQTKADEILAQNFLSGVPDELRQQHSDAVLIAEAKKICAALAQGRSDDQIEEMVQGDLGTTSGMLTLSATIAYCPEKAPG